MKKPYDQDRKVITATSVLHTEAPKQAVEVVMIIRCLHATYKAPINLTSRALHMVATTTFLNYWSSASRTPRWRNDRLPSAESLKVRLLTTTIVPFIAAFEAQKLPALTLSLFHAAARLAHHLAATGLRTPL
jgi:hypothetical protein